MEKRGKLLIVLGLATLAVVGAVTYYLYINSYLVVKPKPKPKPTPAPAPSIGVPRNGEEIRHLLDGVYKLRAPACDTAREKKDQQSWRNCFDRAFEPALMLYDVSEPSLIPELVKVAVQKKYKAPPEIAGADENTRRGYRALMCAVRYSAIAALGRLKDPRALKPLLQIMGESYDTPYAGCYFGLEESLCKSAGAALLKLEPKGVAEALLKNIDEHPYRTEQEIDQALEPKRRRGSLGVDEAYREYQDSNIAECNMNILVKLGDEGKRAVIAKIKSGDLNNSELQLFLHAAGKFKLDKPEIELVKEFLEHKDAGVRAAAADALVENPVPENKDLYLALFNRGYIKQAVAAFGELKNSPELAERLVKVIAESDDPETVTTAVESLIQFPAALVKPAGPLVLEKIKTRDYAKNKAFYQAVAIAGDRSAIRDLMALLHDPRQANGWALDAIGSLQGPESIAALKTIMADKNYARTVLKKEPETIEEREIFDRLNRIRMKALVWYLVQVGDSGESYARRYYSQAAIENAKKQVEYGKKLEEQNAGKKLQ